MQFPRNGEEATAIRSFMAQLEQGAMSRADTTGLDVSSCEIPTRDGQKRRALIYKPEGSGPFPVLL